MTSKPTISLAQASPVYTDLSKAWEDANALLKETGCISDVTILDKPSKTVLGWVRIEGKGQAIAWIPQGGTTWKAATDSRIVDRTRLVALFPKLLKSVKETAYFDVEAARKAADDLRGYIEDEVSPDPVY